MVILLFWPQGGKEQNKINTTQLILVAAVLSYSQEFIYRGYFFLRAREFFGEVGWGLVSVNILLFSLMHIIYKDTHRAVFLGLLSGVYFTGLYYFIPNLILLGLVHTILNIVAVKKGFFEI